MNIPSVRDDILQLFHNSVQQDKLSNSYILCGEKGMGKKTLMRQILKFIVCDTHNACGKCPSCLSLNTGAHPDVIYLEREASKASLGVNSVRDIMNEIYVKPAMSDHKIVIVPEAHLLTPEAQNAMLKVIEEPPDKVSFFLLCDSTAPILQTVLSRSVMVRLNPLKRSILEKIVPDAGEFELNCCGGNPGLLKKFTEDTSFSDLRDGVTDAFSAVASDDDFDVFESVSFFENNKAKKDEINDIILFFLRDVMYKKLGMSEYTVNKDKINHINAFEAKVSAKGCLNMIKAVTDMQKAAGKNGNYTIASTMLLLKCREEINDRCNRNQI